MKKLMPVALAVLAVSLITPAHAADNISRTILVPSPIAGFGDGGNVGDVSCDPVTAPNTCHKGPYAGLHRRLYINGGEPTQGIVGYTIPITARGVTFTLQSVGSTVADWDITFYKTLGAPPNGTPDTDFGTQRSVFALFGTQPETGRVPTGANFAIVTHLGQPNATFRYTAG